MEISSIWKYFLVVICTVNLITARKLKHKFQPSIKEDELKKGLDLQGLLQRQFFADTALADTTKNAVASPFSALLLLAALARGAVGNSLRELEAAIGFKKEEIEDYFKQIFHDLSNMENANLCIASKIYLQQGIQLQNEYRQVMQRTFRTTSQQVDFSKKKRTVNLINKWVSKNTNGKIPRMLDESDVGPSVIVLLINTLHFVAQWQSPFMEIKDRFKTPSGVKIVDMMHRRGTYKYAKSTILDAEIVSIPYAGGDVEFYIVLPRERTIDRLVEVMKSDVDALDDAFRRTRLTYITLTMPMFQTEAKFDLAQLYQELGVQKIFQERSAGLNNMVTSKKYRTRDLHVSKAIHKAYINVTAKGTVAGAASAAGFTHLSSKSPKARVKVDRPFLYFIVAAKQQLFSGIVVDPTRE